MIKAILPTSFSASAEPIKNSTLFKFWYMEGFVGVKPPRGTSMLVILGRTQKAMQALLPRFKVSVILPCSLCIEGNATRAEVGDAMVGEFLVWGTLSQVTLTDLLINAVGAKMEAAASKAKKRARKK